MSDDIKQLEDSDQDVLESGDDLALSALASAQDDGSGDDEVVESDNLATTITSLQNIIERNADHLDEVKEKIKQHRQQLKNIFDNDTQLSEANEQATTFSKQVKERKGQLQSDPEVTKLKVNIGELSEQKKELEEAVSNHLVNYYQLTNSTSFDTSDGDQREFVIKAQVKSKRTTSS